jgi:hypothetical protein
MYRLNGVKRHESLFEEFDVMAMSLHKSGGVTVDRRLKMIAEAAYYRAERRGFQNGDATSDWLEAEAEIDRLVNRGEHGFNQSDTRQTYQ